MQRKLPSDPHSRDSGSKKDGDSIWATYSDLLLSVSIIFLILFVFATFQASLSQINTAQEKREQDNYLQGKVPDKVVQQNAKQIKEVEESLDEINDKNKAINSSIQDLNAMTSALNRKKKVIEEIIHDYKEKTAILSNATESIKDRDAKIAESHGKIKDLQKVVKEIQAEREMFQKKVTLLESERDEKNEDITHLKQVASQGEKRSTQDNQVIESLRGSLQSSQSTIDKLKTELEQKGKAMGDMQAQFNGKMGDMQAQFNGKMGNMQGQWDSKLKKAQGGFAEMSAKATDCEKKLAQTEDHSKTKEVELAQAQKQLDEYAQARRKIAMDMKDMLHQKGISVDSDPVTGTLTLRMDEAFNFKNNSYELSDTAKTALKQIIPVYAHNLFGRKDKTKKITSVSITGFASPRFKQQFIDIFTSNNEAYAYNLELSMNRAKQIAEFIFGDEIGDYHFKRELKEKTFVSGKGYMEPISLSKTTPVSKESPGPSRSLASVKMAEPAQEPCGPYDCGKSRRVEIKFFMNDQGEKGEQ